MKIPPCLSIVILSSLLLSTARAQEQAQDDSVLRRSRIGLSAPEQLKKAKREKAREGQWAWTVLGSAGAGSDSNIYLSPSSERDAVLYDFGLKLEGLRYFSSSQKFKVSLSGGGTFHPGASDINDFSQKLRASYTKRLTKWLRFSLGGKIKHQNDDAVDDLGNNLTRDFEYFSYELKPSLRLKLRGGQSVKVSYQAQRKDYTEVSATPSLDYLSRGPSVEYKVKLGDRVTLRGEYKLLVRRYDDDPSSTSAGVELATNPDEEHDYKTAEIEATWRVLDWLGLSAGYRLSTKDDQFQGFESYDDRRAQVAFTVYPNRALVLRAEGSSARRDYDKRPGTLPGETLEYDRLEARVTGYYQVSRNLAVYARYEIVDRDSNRSTGTSYRDYTAHRVLAGVSFAR